MKQGSTPQQRRAWSIQLLASPRCHGVLSREHHVSRQSLYRCKQQAEQVSYDVFESNPKAEDLREHLYREVLSLLVEAHASYRQIQSCLHQLLGNYFDEWDRLTMQKRLVHRLEKLVAHSSFSSRLSSSFTTSNKDSLIRASI